MARKDQQPVSTQIESLSMPPLLMEIMDASMRPQTEGLQHMIGLPQEVSDMIRGQLEIMRNPQDAINNGLWGSRCVMLYGPGGVGKTTVMHALGAAAGANATGLEGPTSFEVNMESYDGSLDRLFLDIKQRAAEVGGLLLPDSIGQTSGRDGKKKQETSKQKPKTLIVCINEAESLMMNRRRMGHAASDIEKRQQVNNLINHLDALLATSGVSNVLLMVSLNDVSAIDPNVSSRFQMLELKGPTPIQSMTAYMDNISRIIKKKDKDGKEYVDQAMAEYFDPSLVEAIDKFSTARSELKKYAAEHPKASAVRGEKGFKQEFADKAQAVQVTYTTVKNFFEPIVNDPQLRKLSYGAIEQILRTEMERVHPQVMARRRAGKPRRGQPLPPVTPISIATLFKAANRYYAHREPIS